MTHLFRPIRPTAGVLVALVVGLARSGHSQELPADTTPVQLPGITVSVLRTPLELTRAPFAVSVTTQSEIQLGRPGLGLDEALRGVPGVQVDNRYNYALGERISIRGFGARAQFGVRGIRVLVDGIPATFPDGQTSLSHVDLGFLSRAEVVRGATSALYGSSAGGVIQLQTEEPPLTRLSQEIGVVAGSDGLLRLHSTTGGRSGELRYILNVSRLDFEGYREYSSAATQRLNARVGYTGKLGDLQVSVGGVDYEADNPGSLSSALLVESRTRAFPRNVEQRTGETGRQGQVGATWRGGAGPGEVEVTAYSIRRMVDNPIPNTIVVLDRSVAGTRAAYHAGGPALRTSFGVETGQQWDDRQNYGNLAGERGNLALDQRERVSNLAAFAQATASPLQRLTFLASVRYDWYRFHASDRLITDTNPDDSGSLTMSRPSPAVGVTFSASDELNLYANVATAFETPTTTELANRPSGAGGFNPELEPQRTLSFEVGSKGRVGPLAQYQLSAYHADVRDELIPFEVPQAPSRQFFRNAGSSTRRGVEAGLTVAAGPARAVGSYTYTDARFESFAVGNRIFDGNRVPGVAPHRSELILSYDAARGWAVPGVRGRAQPYAVLENRYVSSIPVDDANTTRSPSYLVSDVRAGLQGVRLGRSELAPFVGVTNLAGVEYNTSVVVNAFGTRFFEPGPGRGFYVGATARLGGE